jgi:solute:Na+ symporter, SSS family
VIHWDEVIIVTALGLLVTGIGFAASRWRRGDLDLLEEWGLAGRRFGTIVTWFLLGGDLYTAYTFVAVPALVFGMGAIGLFALPYTIIVYPLIYLIMPRLWQVARNRGYVTASDFVKDRFDSRFLALLIALTGIVATMPYIALQMLGIAVVIQAMGVNVELALVISFLALAVFTYASGLRAPALIAIVKDTLIWITVIVALIVIPPSWVGSPPSLPRCLPPSSSLAQGCLRATRRSPSARHWPCSCIRTPSPAPSLQRASRPSSATWPSCPPTHSCWA